jgi:tetratricopeptide (TPR) repeat protein
MRRALALAVERGRARDAAVLYNRLGLHLWFVEGPTAYLAKLREGIQFAEARGINELVAVMSVGSMEPLFDLGECQELLDAAERLADRLEKSGETLQLVEVRGMHGRVLAAQGHATEALPHMEWAVQTARDSESVDFISGTFSGAAAVRLAAGQVEGALELLSELEQIPGANQSVAYVPFLPAMVRTAIAAGDRALAGRLTIDVSSQYPYHEHALGACRAHLAEASGEPAQAATLYAEAAERWREFGNVPERAFALLGQGRCLLALDRADAEVPLSKARELFASMGYKPALGETEALLTQGEAAAL